MTNLLHETLGVMHENGKNSEDVLWVGSADGKLAITWPEFEAIANFEYDDGFGSQKIGSDLVVVGRSGWWMERHEYDGSEWWEFKQKPVRAPQARNRDSASARRRARSVCGRSGLVSSISAPLQSP